MTRKIVEINQAVVNRFLHSLMYYEFDGMVEGLPEKPSELELYELEVFQTIYEFIENLFKYTREESVLLPLGNERSDEVRAEYKMENKATKEEMLREISQMDVIELRELLSKK